MLEKLVHIIHSLQGLIVKNIKGESMEETDHTYIL